MQTLKAIKTKWFFGILLTILSCSNDDNVLTQEQEAQQLSKMFVEIEALASSESCVETSEWTFTSYGSKACGGPIGYIAYSQNIDTALFLQKIEEHRMAQQAFNEKWGIISDCSIPQEPQTVVCENGNPVFEF